MKEEKESSGNIKVMCSDDLVDDSTFLSHRNRKRVMKEI